MNDPVMIIKNDHTGDEIWRYPGEVLQRTDRGLIAEAFFNRTDLEFNGLLLKKNDRFLELYLHDKWFNIYEIFDRDTDELKGWYCNITRPIRQEAGNLYYDDLALDLLVFPNGHRMVLDEDEFMLMELSDVERQGARDGLKELEDLFDQKHPVDVFTLI
ncbi:MAG: DUF402 domain-containing protein [Chloroflexi bacterium]|nr:DUF402 domain-containing protein [Chloroflexota bacterium]